MDSDGSTLGVAVSVLHARHYALDNTVWTASASGFTMQTVSKLRHSGWQLATDILEQQQSAPDSRSHQVAGTRQPLAPSRGHLMQPTLRSDM